MSPPRPPARLRPQGRPPLQGPGAELGSLPQRAGLLGAPVGLPALQQEVADEELQALPQQAQRGAVGHPEEEGTRVSDQPAPVSALGTPKRGTYLASIWPEFSSKNLICYLSEIIFCLLLGKSHVPQINVQGIIKIKTEKLHVSKTNLLLQNNTGENNFSPLFHMFYRKSWEQTLQKLNQGLQLPFP